MNEGRLKSLPLIHHVGGKTVAVLHAVVQGGQKTGEGIERNMEEASRYITDDSIRRRIFLRSASRARRRLGERKVTNAPRLVIKVSKRSRFFGR